MKTFQFPLLCLTLLVAGCGRERPARLAAVEETRPPDGTEAVRPPADAPLRTNAIGMRLIRISAGEFLMGSPGSLPDARADEKPQHRVRITSAFYLGAYEVTQQEYQQVMGANPSFFAQTRPGKDRVAGRDPNRFPVEQVSWFDAVEFCRRLSDLPAEKQAGRVYRLPTEAEWEYACRAGTTTAFQSGDSLSASQANFKGDEPFGGAAAGAFLLRPAEVGSYAPNAFGLYDLHGNVWEWCADWYGTDYYRVSPSEDPLGPKSGTSRVIRGGGWRTEGSRCRAAYRNADMPAGRYYVTGFRVAMSTGGRAPVVAGAGQAVDAPSPIAESTAPAPATVGTLSAGEDWPRWRGPHGDGTWRGPPLAAQWPQGGLRRLWRQPVGGGYAGVIVAAGRVYVLDHLKTPHEVERVLCFDAATGREIWVHSYPATYGKLEYGNGPRAAPTVSDGRVYALGAVGTFHCLDTVTGKVVWSADLVRDFHARIPIWGLAAAPVVFDNLVILHVGGEPNACLLALDRRTGKAVWRNLPDEAGYATPILIDHHGTPELVCWTPANVCGLDPRTGELFWKVPFSVTYGTAIATPIFQEDTVLVSGYWEGTKAIRLGKGPKDAAVVWNERRRLRALMSQPLYRDGHGYLLDKGYGLTCFEFRTGKKLWDDNNRMTPKGRNPQATMVWLDGTDRALVLNSDGELVLARLDPAGYHEESRTRIIGPTWAHPAYAGNCVYARDDGELVCVSLVAAGSAKR